MLPQLPEAPVLTAGTLTRVLDVSFPAANDALGELERAGVLHRRSIDRSTAAYIARDVLDLVTVAEGALASTQFDTRKAPPAGAVPALPNRG